MAGHIHNQLARTSITDELIELDNHHDIVAWDVTTVAH
jgi:hypothetical protein